MITLRSFAKRAAPIGLPLLLGAIVIGVTPGPGRAAAPAPTAVAIELPASATIGQEIMVKARLTSNGAPVTSRLLELLLDGKTLRTASVDSNGSALLPIRTGELVKAHQATVTVYFSGGPGFVPVREPGRNADRSRQDPVSDIDEHQRVTTCPDPIRRGLVGGRVSGQTTGCARRVAAILEGS